MYGFRKALLEFIPAAISKALILGNGGAAKAVRYALHSLNMEVSTVSRTPRQADEIGYAALPDLITGYPLIVNTTPLGTWPDTSSSLPDIIFSTWSIIPKQPLSCKREKQPELMPATVMRCGWDRRKKIGRYGKKSKKANNQRVKAKSKKIPEKYVGAFFF